MNVLCALCQSLTGPIQAAVSPLALDIQTGVDLEKKRWLIWNQIKMCRHLCLWRKFRHHHSPSGLSVQHQHVASARTCSRRLHMCMQALAQGQKKTKTIYAIDSFSRCFMQSDLQYSTYRWTFSLVCLLPGNKTTGHPLIKWEFHLLVSANYSWYHYQQCYLKVGNYRFLDRGVNMGRENCRPIV